MLRRELSDLQIRDEEEQGGVVVEDMESGSPQESDLFLQWGNRKRTRCARTTTTKDPSAAPLRRRITYRFAVALRNDTHSNSNSDKSLQPSRFTRGSDGAIRSGARNSSAEEEKEENCEGEDEGKTRKKNKNSNGSCSPSANLVAGNGENKLVGGHVWPKLYLGLSNKEKAEDFMAMKGCKPPHRPKKRAKGIQRSILLVCPGGWLADMCQERYEVREKKSSKKRPRGLKAMGNLESDSE